MLNGLNLIENNHSMFVCLSFTCQGSITYKHTHTQLLFGRKKLFNLKNNIFSFSPFMLSLTIGSNTNANAGGGGGSSSSNTSSSNVTSTAQQQPPPSSVLNTVAVNSSSNANHHHHHHNHHQQQQHQHHHHQTSAQNILATAVPSSSSSTSSITTAAAASVSNPSSVGLRPLASLSFAAGFPWATRGKPRRGMMRRAVFSDAQRQGLEKRFQMQKYISKPDRKKLAEKLGLKDSQVSILRILKIYQRKRSKKEKLVSNENEFKTIDDVMLSFLVCVFFVFNEHLWP